MLEKLSINNEGMPKSFLASIGSNKLEGLKNGLLNLFPRTETYQLLDFDDFQIGFNGIHKTNFYFFDQQTELAFFVIGSIRNLDAVFNSSKLGVSFTDAEKIALLYGKLGISFAKLLFGAFAVIIFNESKKELQVLTDTTGQMPIYFVKNGEELFLTSELKVFSNRDLFPIKLIEQKKFLDFANHASKYCFLAGFEKIIAGTVYTFNYYEAKIKIQHKSFSEIKISENKTDFEESLMLIYTNLMAQVLSGINKNKRIGIPLSGGLDSGIIAAMAKKEVKNLQSFTIGTELGNEFDQAREAATFLGTKHTEIFIDNDGFMDSVLHGIYLNEFAHPVYAEGYPGFYHIFKKAHNEIDTYITGYGADLILGDIYNLEDKSTINKISEHACHHTQWTGEFSPFIAGHFNAEIIHPFWNLELINMAISLPWHYKYKGEEVKFILREMAVRKKLLPKDYAWRKKTAFNVGSSTDKLLAKMLQIEDYKDYESKGKFLYKVLQYLFVDGNKLDQLDYKSLLKK